MIVWANDHTGLLFVLNDPPDSNVHSIGLYNVTQHRKGLRRNPVIRVKEINVFTPSSKKPRIARGRQPKVLCVLHEAEPIVLQKLREHTGRIIRGTVIDADYFKIFVCLRLNRLEALPKVWLYIINWDDNGNHTLSTSQVECSEKSCRSRPQYRRPHALS
jgi:hypothetical protein